MSIFANKTKKRYFFFDFLKRQKKYYWVCIGWIYVSVCVWKSVIYLNQSGAIIIYFYCDLWLSVTWCIVWMFDGLIWVCVCLYLIFINERIGKSVSKLFNLFRAVWCEFHTFVRFPISIRFWFILCAFK